MAFKVQVGPAQISIHQGQTVMITEPSGQVNWPSERGLYFRDTRVVSAWAIYANGMPWDCHTLNHEMHQMLVPELDRVLFHLVNDLEERGLLEKTLVIAMGEFGRSPWLNASHGREHYPAAWSLAMNSALTATGRAVFSFCSPSRGPTSWIRTLAGSPPSGTRSGRPSWVTVGSAGSGCVVVGSGVVIAHPPRSLRSRKGRSRSV